MFLGKFYHTIDTKFRLTIPARFREIVPDGIYLSQSPDGNLTAYSKDGFKKLSDITDNMDPFDRKTREITRDLFPNTMWLDYDNTGRILIPSFLIEYADLGTEVVIAGTNKTFEIWNPEKWAERNRGHN